MEFRKLRSGRQTRKNRPDGFVMLWMVVLCVLLGNHKVFSALFSWARWFIGNFVNNTRRIMRLLRRGFLIFLVLLCSVKPRDLVESTILWDLGYVIVVVVLRRFSNGAFAVRDGLVPGSPSTVPEAVPDNASDDSDNDKDADDVCNHDPAQSEPAITIDLDRTVLAVRRPEKTFSVAPQVDRSITSSIDSGACSIVYSDHDPIDLSFGSRPPPSIPKAEITSISSVSIYKCDSSRSIASPPGSTFKEVSHSTAYNQSEWVMVGSGKKNRKPKGNSSSQSQTASPTQATARSTSRPSFNRANNFDTSSSDVFRRQRTK